MSNESTSGATDPSPYVDAADRLERVIDTQLATLDGIDTKAEHVTRLVAVLLSVLLTIVSVAVRIDGIDAGTPHAPVVVAFVGGVGSLLLALIGGIVTYLSSRVKMGLHENVGHVSSNPTYETNETKHHRRVLGSYARAIEQNRGVLETNARRFRLTLVCLMIGVSLLSVAVSLLVSGTRGAAAWSGVAVSLVGLGFVGWYVLTGRYLTLEERESDNE